MIGPRLRAIIVKELWAILRDPRARIILILPPILQLVLFGLATTLDVTNIAIGIVDHDGGRWSREVIARVAGSPNVARLVPLASEAQARGAIDRQEVIGVLRFGPGFSGDVSSGRGGVIGAVFDGRRSNAAQIVASYVDRIAADVGAERRDDRSAPQGGSVAVNWFNPNLDYLWFTMPVLVAIVGAVSALSVVTQSVARERELGTFDQLMVSPLRVHEILIGKMTPPILIGGVMTAVYLVLIPTLFGVPLAGSIPAFLFATFFYLLSLTGIGMLVSVLSGTQQQAFLGTFLVMIPAILLSGYASPVDNMPGWLQLIAQANPLTHFVVIAQGIFLKATPPADIIAKTVPLIAIAAVTLTAAAALFRARME